MSIAEAILKHVVPVKNMPEFEVKAHYTPEERDELIKNWQRCCYTYKEAYEKLVNASPYCDTSPLTLKIIVEKFNDRQKDMVEIIKLHKEEKGFLWRIVTPAPHIATKLIDLPTAFVLALESNPKQVKMLPEDVRCSEIVGETFLKGELVCHLSFLPEKFRNDPVYMGRALALARKLEVTEFTPNPNPPNAVLMAISPALLKAMKHTTNTYTKPGEPAISYDKALEVLTETYDTINTLKAKEETHSISLKNLFLK